MTQIKRVQLGFDSLETLDDGRIGKLLMRHIQQVAQDVINRPNDKAKRKVSLEFSIEPILDVDDGECHTVKVEIECKSKVPTFRSKAYEMQLSGKGLFYNQDFPGEIDQTALPFKNEKDEKES